tara:strand:- start:120316 stop:120909 length:594 start_codon:yes stop_codon:yes gene_type:complete
VIVILCSVKGFSQQTLNYSSVSFSAEPTRLPLADTLDGDIYPEPKKVLRRSLIVPGWGQVTNKQAWKVPIVYGLIGGLVYYSIHTHDQYTDYRAAFYNLNPDTPDDQRFGPTPDYISQNTNLNSLRENRNFYRNRRDLTFVMVGLAYALNAIDAYVFAHLRPFDVSDDLSFNTKFAPGTLLAENNQPVPTISVSINF